MRKIRSSTFLNRRKNLISKEVADKIEDDDELDELGIDEGNADPGHPQLLTHLTLQGTKVPEIPSLSMKPKVQTNLCMAMKRRSEAIRPSFQASFRSRCAHRIGAQVIWCCPAVT